MDSAPEQAEKNFNLRRISLPAQLELQLKQSAIPYQKVDMVRFACINDDVSLSFYQFDYQMVADQADPENQDSFKTTPILVSRIVMDMKSFRDTFSMLETALKAIDADKK